MLIGEPNLHDGEAALSVEKRESAFNLLLSMLLFSLLISGSWVSVTYGFSAIDNRGLLPIGEVESFMANTGTALSGSTGAVYYNPAGLASISRNHISVSANSYLSTKSEMRPIQTIDGVDMDFSSKGLQAIPSAFVSTGQKDKWRYAFSILIPHQVRVQDSVLFKTPTYPTFQYSRTNFFQTLMAGLSVATSVDAGFDIGVGCHYTMFQTTQSSATNGLTNAGTNSLLISSYFDAQVDGILCTAGLQQQVNEDFRFGFTARLPLMTTSKKGTSSLFVQNPNTGQAQALGPKAVEPEIAMPLDMTFGIEYRLSPTLKSYADLSYQLSATYTSGDISATESSHKATPRGSVGLRYQMLEKYELFAGVAYNPSSVNVNDQDYSENFIAGTVGGRWQSGSSSIGVGVLYAQSSGNREAGIYNAALTEIGRKTADVSTSAMGIMISSGYVF